jgi:chaperone required for assembly of F1-ATPase
VTDAPTLPRRFYQSASVADLGEGFGVKLDARTLKTPGGAAFIAPARALAELCAGEWDEQSELIVPASMPISQLAFATVDWTAKNRDQLVNYIAGFAETDLCCHRAEAPADLAARQTEAWDPIVTWGASALGASLPVVNGVIAARVDANAIAALRNHAAMLDDFRLTALSQSTSLAGSALIGFALVRGALDADQAFQAAALDNLWSLERWGEDEEARARLDRHRKEFEDIARFIGALP